MLGEVLHTFNTPPCVHMMSPADRRQPSLSSDTTLTRRVLYYPKTWSLAARAGGVIRLTFVMPRITFVWTQLKGCPSFHLQMSITIFPLTFISNGCHEPREVRVIMVEAERRRWLREPVQIHNEAD